METVITVSVIIGLIMLGVLLIHLLNGQHNERIAAFHYSDALPGVGRRSRKSRRPASPPDRPSPPPPHAERRDGPRTGRGALTGAGGRKARPHAKQGLFLMNGVTMQPPESPPAGRAEVRIVAASPEVARQVAEVLRSCFDGTEQRSYPAGTEGGTRLHLTVDTTHTAEPARSWLVASRSSGRDTTQTDEV